jgi:hypothetical protein
MAKPTFRLFSEKLGHSDAATFVGRDGDIFFNRDNGALRVSDGTTPGGSPIQISTDGLIGNIDANVNLRSGTLASLLPLAGGTSEIGYATDANALVKFNGAVGGAAILDGGATLEFTLTPANYLSLSDPASGVAIDCNNITQLKINIDPALTALNPFLTNLNIRFPNSAQIQSFNVYLPQNIVVLNTNTFTITPFYQPTETGTVYNVIAADQPTTTDYTKPLFRLANYPYFNVTFVANINSYGGSSYWTRLPLKGEGGWMSNSITTSVPLVGTNINGTAVAVTLANNVVQSSSTLTLTAGLWMISGYVNFQVSADLVATELLAGSNLSSTTTVPTISTTTSSTRMTANLPTAGNFTLALPPIMYSVGQGPQDRYGNVRATFTAGTVTATMYQRAIRIA